MSGSEHQNSSVVIGMVIKPRGNAHKRLINLINGHACIQRIGCVVSEIESLRSEW